MDDIERYITDEAVQAAASGYYERSAGAFSSRVSASLRAALPTILARHRADILREAEPLIDGLIAQAQREAREEALEKAAARRSSFCSRSPMCPIADDELADEVVAE